MRKDTLLGEHSINIPAHREVATGTLNDILNQVALWNSVPREQLIEMIRGH